MIELTYVGGLGPDACSRLGLVPKVWKLLRHITEGTWRSAGVNPSEPDQKQARRDCAAAADQCRMIRRRARQAIMVYANDSQEVFSAGSLHRRHSVFGSAGPIVVRFAHQTW